MTADFSFLKLTTQRTGAATSPNQNQNAQKTQNNQDALKTQDVFTAAKNGVQPQNNAADKGALAGGDSGFSGTNAFGESGYGDTLQFSSKATNPSGSADAGVSVGGYKGGISLANNDNELAEVAEALGCDADESTVKSTLQSMSPEELVKLDSDTLDTAADLGLINKADIEKKTGTDGKKSEKQENKDDQSQKLAFGKFTMDKEEV